VLGGQRKKKAGVSTSKLSTKRKNHKLRVDYIIRPEGGKGEKPRRSAFKKKETKWSGDEHSYGLRRTSFPGNGNRNFSMEIAEQLWETRNETEDGAGRLLSGGSTA